jgi:hypothetical protein
MTKSQVIFGFICLLLCLTHLSAEEFEAVITAVEGKQVWLKQITKGRKTFKDEQVLHVRDDVVVAKARYDLAPPTRLVPYEHLADGLDNKDFRAILVEKKQIICSIVTDDSTGLIQQVNYLVSLPKKKTKVESPALPKRNDDLSEKDRESYDYVMSGIKEQRNRLKSGVFRTTGFYSEIDDKSKEYRGEHEIFCAFDWPENRLRFDQSLPRFPIVAMARFTAPPKTGDPEKVVVERTCLIITPNGAWEKDTNAIRALAADADFKNRLYSKPFDIRFLGLHAYSGFTTWHRFEDEFDRRKSFEPHSIVRDANGLWNVVWQFPSLQIAAWIDEPKGFGVTRSEYRLKDKDSPSGWQAEPMEKSAVSWLQKDGAWAPKTFSLTARHGKISYDFAFEWELLNQPVPDKLFNKEDFDLNGKRTLLVDAKSDKQFVTGVLNDKSPKKETENGASRMRLIVVAAIVLMAIALLIYFKIRK